MARAQKGWDKLSGSGRAGRRQGVEAGRRQAQKVQVFNYIKTCRFTGVPGVDRRLLRRRPGKGGRDDR
jgi:hypothetical protein